MKLIQILLVAVTLLSMTEAAGRQTRPLNLARAERKDEFNHLEKDTIQLEKELKTLGLIRPSARQESKDSNTKSNFEIIRQESEASRVVPPSGENDPGVICQDKVMTVSEIVYDEQVVCNHVSYQNCYQAYKTVYKAQQTENCRDNFKKDCFIEYEDVAKTEVIRLCAEKASRNCSIEGSETCTVVFQTICETKFRSYNTMDESANCQVVPERVCFDETNPDGTVQETCRVVPKTDCKISQQDVNKSFPETECRKEPCDVCGPEKCPVVTSTVCEDKEKTFVTPVPKERCELKPFKICSTESVSLPSLEQVNECVDVPKEVCSIEQVNPRQVARPVIKKWCTKIVPDDPDTTTEAAVETAGRDTADYDGPTTDSDV